MVNVRLGTRVLVLTLAITLVLTAVVIVVVSRTVTANEVDRAHADIQQAIDRYFERVDNLAEHADDIVRLLIEDPSNRAYLEQAGAEDARMRELAVAQLGQESFGNILQTELTSRELAPAFHMLLNVFGDVLVVWAGDDVALTEALSSGAVAWPVEAVVEPRPHVRAYQYVDDRLYLAFGVPLRIDLSQPPTHAYFVGYRIDDAWVRRQLGVEGEAQVGRRTAMAAWFMVAGQIVAEGSAGLPLEQLAPIRQAAGTTLSQSAGVDDEPDRSIAFEAGGERFVGEVRTFAAGADAHGGVAVASSLDRALTGLRRLQGIIAGVAVAVAVAAIVAARVLARMISRPVEQLVDATQRVARGEFRVAVQTDRRDELGQLARSFGQMAAGLEQRDLIKDTFGKFVDPSIVEGFLADPSRLRLGGQQRVQSVLFSDLANFTALSEKLRPEELVELLNSYLGEAADIVATRRGIVDKFIGDAVVAFWGPPLLEAHADAACLAALDCVERTRRFAERCTALGGPRVHVRIGIATGEVLVGNIGSRSKYNYTVMGDTVNLASRLEGLNKLYHTQILTHESTITTAGDAILARRIDRVRVVGRREPVDVFEVLAPSNAAVAAATQRCQAYAAALRLYEARDWSAARTAFEAIAAATPDDGPERVMAQRCAKFDAAAPDPNWDGAWNVDTK